LPARFLDPTGGIPREDTSRRVLARLDPAAFEGALRRRMQAVQQLAASRLIAIGGKTPPGSSHRRDGEAAIHLVSAWALEDELSLGRVAVDEEPDEITAIPELLRLSDISGARVTIDATGCPGEIAATIRERGGDAVPPAELNRPRLYEPALAAVDEGLEQGAARIDEHRTEEIGHGRHEVRTDAISPAPATADREGRWRDLGAVGVTSSERADAPRQAILEGRSSIPSRLLPAEDLAGAVRGHRGIEDRRRWHSEVGFREDESRVRTGHAAADRSVIRRFAPGFLRRETECRRGIATKRLKCALSEEYREKVLSNTRDKMPLPWDRRLLRHGDRAAPAVEADRVLGRQGAALGRPRAAARAAPLPL
jgi:predicted transposase YbfD/YdcC